MNCNLSNCQGKLMHLVGLLVVSIFILVGCATPQEKYPNAFREISRADSYIKSNEKLLSDIEIYQMLSKAALSEKVIINSKELTANEAKQNLQSLQDKSQDIQTLKNRTDIIKNKKHDLLMHLKQDNASKIQEATSELTDQLDSFR